MLFYNHRRLNDVKIQSKQACGQTPAYLSLSRPGRSSHQYLLLSILKLVQFAIDALAMQEFFVTALFHDAAFVQNNDAVNVADRRETVGNDDRGTIRHQFIQGI